MIYPKHAMFLNLGLIEYEKAWQLQQELVERRSRQEIPDLLLLGQHPHVITVGRRQTGRANILTDRFPIFEVERGGDATYHGPGQLVGYPILLLEEDEKDPHQYLRRLEQALCQVCQDYGVEAMAKEKYTGVWTADGQRKIASLGVAMRNGVTFHGFALNVTTDLSCFSALNPCGLPSQVMTSIEKERGQKGQGAVSVDEVYPRILHRMGERLGREFAHGEHSSESFLSLSCA